MWLRKAFEFPETATEETPLNKEELSFGSELAYGVFLSVINATADEVRTQCQEQCSTFQVHAMDSAGKVKYDLYLRGQ